MIFEFTALTKTAAIRKAINFWYINFYGNMRFMDFLKDCSIKKIDLNYIVIYKENCNECDGYK